MNIVMAASIARAAGYAVRSTARICQTHIPHTPSSPQTSNVTVPMSPIRVNGSRKYASNSAKVVPPVTDTSRHSRWRRIRPALFFEELSFGIGYPLRP
ncbi:hypothetical protein [Nocardia sp. NPDC052566]|uniref:hypothetical protein n=1 Tax=Nocardia sp. NPDC052566 TaxID=3364330 RepID=UPI0037CA205F